MTNHAALVAQVWKEPKKQQTLTPARFEKYGKYAEHSFWWILHSCFVQRASCECPQSDDNSRHYCCRVRRVRRCLSA